MALFRTVGPGAEPVSLAEAKAHLRLDHESEDVLITSLIRAAREEVEAACGLALIAQDWRLTLDRLPASKLVTLRRHPVVGRLGVAGGSSPPVNIVFNVSAPDPRAFAKSEAQVTGMLARAVSRGMRTL